MTGLSAGHVGIAGEVRCVVKREDGTIKEDTGYQKNLILNQGLDFFGGDKGSNIFYSCVIGAGNAVPEVTQTQLSSFLAIVSGIQSSIKYDYSPDSSNLYKMNKVYKYTFAGLNNANVSEVGLASQGATSTDYYLCTRALLKDAFGAPTTITILLGETLEVYYKIWKVISVLDSSHVVNMLDGKGGSVPYNVIVRPAFVGDIGQNEVGGSVNKVWTLTAGSSDLTTIPNYPARDSLVETGISYTPYSQGAYKIVVNRFLGISDSNHNIRHIASGPGASSFSFHPFQIRFGSVATDAPIPKTSLQTLVLPLEISWGRYEGAL